MTHAHTATGKTARTEVYTYTYDEKDRVSTVRHKLGSTEVTLASYTYDTFGRMATRKLHGSSTNQLTYSYNIQNWLTGISSTKFTQTLGYGSNYNGNISSMNWNANGASHSYTFTYDGVNRMLNATHGTGAYTEKVTLYDKNGNIKALQRYGNGLIDDLSYTYSGNQLTNVKDESGNTAGFTDGANVANEYTYDNNGNLTKDSNKNISSIEYNSLNLPSVVTFSGGNSITYTYAADGTKLRTVHKMGGVTVTTDYCSNVIYESGAQKRLLTEEGYVDLSVTTHAYYYFFKDHQGNNRVVINNSGTVSETNHYYPFGGVFASTGNVQPYKYNGKELDTKCGLNWYDYGARHYDAMLGRWLVVDLLAEKYYGYGPYAYCLNSPVKFIDSDGRRVRPSNPVRRGYRNAGRPNPYAFYPGGLQPLSYRRTTNISYNGKGLYEQIALGEQNYVRDITIGGNAMQMSNSNQRGMFSLGLTGLVDNQKQYSEQMLEMIIETKYHIDGRISKTTNYTIKDPTLASAQDTYFDAYNSLSEQLGDDMTMLEKNAIIQKEIGLSPLMTIMMDMLNNPDAYKTESQKHIIPEFRQGY